MVEKTVPTQPNLQSGREDSEYAGAVSDGANRQSMAAHWTVIPRTEEDPRGSDKRFALCEYCVSLKAAANGG